jgi:hypothetical protein
MTAAAEPAPVAVPAGGRSARSGGARAAAGAGCSRRCSYRPASGTSLLVAPICCLRLQLRHARAGGGYAPAFTLDNSRSSSNPQPFITSLFLALSGTALCLLVAFPRVLHRVARRQARGLFIILLVIRSGRAS